jgi:hypothetical protein
MPYSVNMYIRDHMHIRIKLLTVFHDDQVKFLTQRVQLLLPLKRYSYTHRVVPNRDQVQDVHHEATFTCE